MCGGGASPGDGSVYDGEGGGSASAGAFNNSVLGSDVQAALDAEAAAGQRSLDVSTPSLSQQGGRTFDASNGWGLDFNDRVAYGGWTAGLAPYGGLARAVGAKIDNVIENPFATIIDVLATLAPVPANPIGIGMAIGRTAIGAGAMLGLNPSIGQMATAAVRDAAVVGETGQTTAQSPAGGGAPGGTAVAGGYGGMSTDTGGGSDWASMSDLLSTDMNVLSGSSEDTVPSTLSSLDPRTSYGFSPGQSVDYARLSGGFGGSNIGARAGWRSGASGGWG